MANNSFNTTADNGGSFVIICGLVFQSEFSLRLFYINKSIK